MRRKNITRKERKIKHLPTVKAPVDTNYATCINLICSSAIPSMSVQQQMLVRRRKKFVFFRVYLKWAKWQKFTDQPVLSVQLKLFGPTSVLCRQKLYVALQNLILFFCAGSKENRRELRDMFFLFFSFYRDRVTR